MVRDELALTYQPSTPAVQTRATLKVLKATIWRVEEDWRRGCSWGAEEGVEVGVGFMGSISGIAGDKWVPSNVEICWRRERDGRRGST